jgi:hypothetical protein
MGIRARGLYRERDVLFGPAHTYQADLRSREIPTREYIFKVVGIRDVLDRAQAPNCIK